MTFAPAHRLAFMADPDRDGNRRRRAFLLFGLGALGALGVKWLPRLSSLWPSAPTTTSFWGADRDGERVIGLGCDLFAARSWPVECPVDVVPGGEGSLWVLRADRADPTALPRLLRLSAEGEVLLDLPLPGAERIHGAVGGGECLALVDVEGKRQLCRIDLDGERVVLARAAPGARLAVGAGGVLLVEGECLRLVGGEAHARPSGGRVLALAPADQGWWLVEELEGERFLRRLDARLDSSLRRTLADLDLDAEGILLLAPRPGRGGVWLVNHRGEAVRFDAAGRVRARGAAPLPGVERCVATEDGGVLLALPGAIVRLDFLGRPCPGQGGFDFLVALAREHRRC